MTQRRQLNLRDDEIYERAHRLAERLGITTKDAVRVALAAYEAWVEPRAGQQPGRARRLAELEALQERLRATTLDRGHAEDDAVLYDERGLPR